MAEMIREFQIKHGWHGWWKIIARVVIGMLVWLVVSTLLMFIIKWCCERLNLDNTWASILATVSASLAGAIPGIICAILAMKQTDRLHDLEARYHRPCLVISGAELEAKKAGDVWKMNLAFDYTVANDSYITGVEGEAVCFFRDNERYRSDLEVSTGQSAEETCVEIIHEAAGKQQIRLPLAHIKPNKPISLWHDIDMLMLHETIRKRRVTLKIEITLVLSYQNGEDRAKGKFECLFKPEGVKTNGDTYICKAHKAEFTYI